MYLIDTHCHLNDKQLYPHADQHIARAVIAGVSVMFVVGYDEESSRVAVELSERFPEVYAIVGIHPTETSDDIERRMGVIATLAHHPKVIAIGETGLDHHWQKEEKQHDLQKEYFRAHIALASRLGLPIVVHSRGAIEATLKVLRETPVTHGGVMHCYSGSAESVTDFINAGMHISIAGPVTFLNARTAKEVAAIVPDEYLLIETDSPYLTPHPHRGKRNEPGLLPLVAQAVAEIRKQPLANIAALTSANAEQLFHVKLK